MKPHHGRIKDAVKIDLPNGGYRIMGYFLDHPWARGPLCTTTEVLSHCEETNVIETKNSMYTLVDSGEESRFQDFPMKGEQVEFLGKNGYEHELEGALKVFKIGERYTIENIDVGNYSTSIEFVGFDGDWNSVMFSGYICDTGEEDRDF